MQVQWRKVIVKTWLVETTPNHAIGLGVDL